MADNLSRAEARDRAGLLSDVSYEVDLDLTRGERTFLSTTTLRFSSAEPGASTFVDLEAETVREVVLNGQALDPARHDSERNRLALEALEAENELRVVADCRYQHTGVGLHRVVDPVDGHVYLHTQFEPFDAHRVFACFDQPDLKAPWTLRVTAPPDWTVVSNSPPADASGGRWSFLPTPPLPTYLAAVVAGPFHRVDARHRNLELAIYCRESLAPHLDPDQILEVTRQGLDFFEAEFGVPYPFAKYDQLFVPEFNFGAMENPGCVTFNESMVFRSRVTETAYEHRANVILHEMAHMWFGDLVTMRWWDDLWLNESFATYMASDALARATRFRQAWVRFAWGTKAGAVSQDQLPSTHPISADIVDTDAVRLHFDGITYSKGASVLKQLVAWVGQDAFTAGLRDYFPRHRWGNAELVDFLAALERTSGRDLGEWSKEWLETAGVNTLRAQAEVGADRYTSVIILQEAPPDHPRLRSHRVAVGSYRLGDEGLVRDLRVELDVTGPRTEVVALAGQPVADLLLVNDDDLAYAKVRLDAASVATLEAHLARVVDPLARSLCWATTWDMVRDAELPVRRYVALVATHAPAEPDDSTLERLLGQARAGVDAYGDPANRETARLRLASVARAGLAEAEPGSDRQLLYARALVSTADRPEDLAFLRGLLEGTEEVPGLAVDTDLRWQIVAALAAAGADPDGLVVGAEEERDPTDIGQRRAAAARASRPTPEAKAEAWEQANSGQTSLALLRAVISGLSQPAQDELLAPYVRPYFSSLHRLWSERTPDEALTLTRGLFPSTLVSEHVVAATDRALADETLPGPARRILLEGRDELQRALRARAVDGTGTRS